MPLSHCIENFLSVAHVDYQVVRHGSTASAFDSARAAHVPASEVVKAVMLKDAQEDHYTMALLPASNRLEMSWLPRLHGEMRLASEEEFDQLFPDCATGAVPGFGQAFQMDMLWDDELMDRDTLYFEAGDHQALIRIKQGEFRALFAAYPHLVISQPRDRHHDP